MSTSSGMTTMSKPVTGKYVPTTMALRGGERRRLRIFEKGMLVTLHWMREIGQMHSNDLVSIAIAGSIFFPSAISARWHTVQDRDLRVLMQLLDQNEPDNTKATDQQVERGIMYARQVRVLDFNLKKSIVTPDKQRQQLDRLFRRPLSPFPSLESLTVSVEQSVDLHDITKWFTSSLEVFDLFVPGKAGCDAEWNPALLRVMECLRIHCLHLDTLSVQGIPLQPNIFPQALVDVIRSKQTSLVAFHIDAHALSEDMLDALRGCVGLECIHVTQRTPFFNLPRRVYPPTRLAAGDNLDMTLEGNLFMLTSLLRGITIQPGVLSVYCWTDQKSILCAHQLPYVISTTFKELKELSISFDLSPGVSELPYPIQLSDFQCLGEHLHYLKKLHLVCHLNHSLSITDSDLSLCLSSLHRLEDFTLLWDQSAMSLQEKSYGRRHERLTWPGILRLVHRDSLLQRVYLGHIDLKSLFELPDVPLVAPSFLVRTKTADVGTVWETALVLQRKPYYITLELDDVEQTRVVTKALTYVEQARLRHIGQRSRTQDSH
ncbi:hypothetical protein CALVIDRAFT_562083 [Calocera viscosa TUFC12733]|uniref:Uncharacterized protein n=1 Tax=Calocera viscosa (strain TUFC12733) TaxID=1330018 RepID=A0A167PCA1_CALVF|nr:hypothetical protein CALVIDRAFT_562083 [Calocera viscosa TUFC12733]